MLCQVAALSVLAGLGWGTAVSAQPQAPAKGTLVKINGLQALAPAEWKAEKPANRLRSYQFRLPRAKDDKEDGELGVLPELPGKPEENLQRWKELFVPPEGKTVDDIARVDRFKVGGAAVTYLDIAGTYMYKDRPLAAKGTPRPDYRMLAVMLETDKGVHLLRLVGPAKTVQAHKEALDSFVRSLK